MKTAIISTFPPRKCGIGIYTKRLRNSLDKEMPVLSLKEHKYPDRNVIGILDSGLNSFLKAADYLKKQKIESVLIEHEYAFYNKIYFLFFLFLMRINGIKTTLEVHTIVSYDDFIKKNIFRIYNFKMFLLCNKIIVHTEYAKKRLLGAGFFKNKIKIIPLAIPDYKKLDRKKTSEIKLLCFGFIWYDKGTDIAVRAFGGVDGIKLKIVGSINPSATEKQRKFFDNIKKMAKQYKNIEVIDRFVTDEEKEKLYAEADFIVMPYRMISQSAVLTEVWSHGKIPIVSDLAPLKEEVKDKYGILFKSRDAQDLKKVTMEISKDRKKQEIIKKNIQKLAEKRSFKETAKAIRSVLA